MQENRSYEYVVIRLVPRVEREEFLNIGVVLYAPTGRFLQMKFHLDKKRLRALFPGADIKTTQKYLEAFMHICSGSPDAGPIGKLTVPERFRWISSTRSTTLQMSKVHSGLCTDPASKLCELYEQLVLVTA